MIPDSKPHLVDMMANDYVTPLSSVLFKEKVKEIILEHRPWTIAGEMDVLINICVDMYSMGLEDARDIVRHITENNLGTQAPAIFRTETKNPTGSGG